MNTKLDILKKIKSGDVAMKPRWHFALRSSMLLLGVVFVSLLVVYLISFIMFFLRQSGIGFAPLYGFRGITIFVMNSPWLLIASAGALLLVVQQLVREYSFSFKRPLLYSMIGIVLAVLLGSYVIGQTQFHPQMQGVTAERNVPIFGSLYRGIYNQRPGNITFGVVTSVTESGFIMMVEDESVAVQVTEDTRLRGGNRKYAVGTEVLVFGDRENDIITALGVRPAPENFNSSAARRPGMQSDNTGTVRPDRLESSERPNRFE